MKQATLIECLNFARFGNIAGKVVEPKKKRKYTRKVKPPKVTKENTEE